MVVKNEGVSKQFAVAGPVDWRLGLSQYTQFQLYAFFDLEGRPAEGKWADDVTAGLLPSLPHR